MYEHWRGHGFIRIHEEGCRHAESKRETDTTAQHAMYLDGRYETLKQAEAAAEQKVNRWAKCTECC